MTLVVRVPQGLDPEREYAVSVLLREFLGLEVVLTPGPPGAVSICANDEPNSPILAVADVFFDQAAGAWLRGECAPRAPLAEWEIPPALRAASGSLPDRVPVLFSRTLGDGSLCRLEPGRVEIGLDLFGSAFFMLTRYEEVAKPQRDGHGRFPARGSLAVRADVLGRPVVNEYVEVLWSALRRLWPRLERRRRDYHVLPTHDVDRAFGSSGPLPRMLLSAGADLIRRRDPGLAWRRLAAVAAVRRGDARSDLYNTFDWLMDVSERSGLVSAFYFLAGRTDPRFDGDYTLDDPRIRKLMRRIAERGHEVGLHASYASFGSPETIRSEYDALRRAAEAEGVRQDVWGGRQHYLRWEAPTTWQGWDEAGLDYDSTVGFAERPGFRCGACWEFPVFNLRSRRVLRLRERPLVMMDVSLLGRDYMDLGYAEAAVEVERILASCRLVGGDAVLLWHNNNVLAARDRRLYATAVAGNAR